MVDPVETNQGGTSQARILKGDAIAIAPLYSAARLLKKSAVEIDELKAAAAAELAAARAEAARIVQEAKDKAVDLRAAAEIEAEKIKVNAANEARAAVTQRVEALLTSMRQAVESWTNKYPKDVVAYAFKLAHRVVECEFVVKPERIVEFVKNALEKARFGASGIVIYLHPDDVSIVQSAAAKLAEKMQLPETPAVVEDRTLQRSSVRIEIGANRAAYHAGVDAAFADLKKQLERGL